MANITVYQFDNFSEKYTGVFAGVYNDFRQKAATDYNFELEPLAYEDFVKSVNDGLIKCIILFEQDVPTGFLTYTTVISYSLELNIIHVLGDDNSMQKRCLLLQKFLEENAELLSQKVVTYAVLGKQEEIVNELPKFGFTIVNQSVMKFDFQNAGATLSQSALPRLKNGFRLTSWNDKYFNAVVEIIHSSFKDASDAKFDPRFRSTSGCQDIVFKIVGGIYGEFLKEETKILLYKEKPVGICFANLTNSSIANVPLVAVKENLRGKALGVYLLKTVVTDVWNSVLNGKRVLSELNATCDSNYLPAYKMYQAVGFVEEYSYKQSFR